MTAQQRATPLQRGPVILLRRFQRALLDYLNMLCGKGYLKGGDVIKMLNAPSAVFTANVLLPGLDQIGSPAGVSRPESLHGQRRRIRRTTIFATTQNYVYDTPLVAGSVPYGQKGFVTIHKGGDASRLSIGQASLLVGRSWYE